MKFLLSDKKIYTRYFQHSNTVLKCQDPHFPISSFNWFKLEVKKKKQSPNQKNPKSLKTVLILFLKD